MSDADDTMKGQHMDTKVRVGSRYSDKEVITYRTEIPDGVATLAYQFLDRWGLVATIPDGEDSAGRAKLRLPTTQELVTRAFDIAEASYAESRKRGHTVDLPDLNEINRESDEKAAAKRLAEQA